MAGIEEVLSVEDHFAGDGIDGKVADGVIRPEDDGSVVVGADGSGDETRKGEAVTGLLALGFPDA
jgi:hypothetical protein